MSKKDVDKFYELISKDNNLKEKLLDILKNSEGQKLKKICDLASSKDLNFTQEELIELSKNITKSKLSNEDLAKISSGNLNYYVTYPTIGIVTLALCATAGIKSYKLLKSNKNHDEDENIKIDGSEAPPPAKHKKIKIH